MADDMDSWCNASLVAQVRPFLSLSANIRAVLQLIEGPNPRAEAVASFELQGWHHDKQLHLMCDLFEAQLVTVREAAREAVRKEIRAQFAEVGLSPEAQEEDAE